MSPFQPTKMRYGFSKTYFYYEGEMDNIWYVWVKELRHSVYWAGRTDMPFYSTLIQS